MADWKSGLVVYPERRIKLGAVAVDSGRLLLADPTYIGNRGGVEALDDAPIGDRHARPALDGMGLLFTAGLGDGMYDVYATVGTVPGWGERIKRVEMMLIEDDTAQVRADRHADSVSVSIGGNDLSEGFGDVMRDTLFMQADAAEYDRALVGSVLARCYEARGLRRGDFAAWLGTSEVNLAALSCEPRPVPTITCGPGGGGGVLHPVAFLFALADRYGVESDRLMEAYREGLEDLEDLTF